MKNNDKNKNETTISKIETSIILSFRQALVSSD